MPSELAERIADAVYEAERDYIDSGLPIEKLTAIVEGVLKQGQVAAWSVGSVQRRADKVDADNARLHAEIEDWQARHAQVSKAYNERLAEIDRLRRFVKQQPCYCFVSPKPNRTKVKCKRCVALEGDDASE